MKLFMVILDIGDIDDIPPEKSGGSVEASGRRPSMPHRHPFRLRNQAAPLKQWSRRGQCRVL